MKKILSCALALALFTGPTFAASQFENWQHNRQYNQNGNGYPPPPPPPPEYYHKKHHHNNNNGAAWAAVGGFLGGLFVGEAINPGYGYAPPPVGYCGTVWTMEPDGFGGWEQTPHTVCQ